MKTLPADAVKNHSQQNTIDYDKLAKLYDKAEIGQAVELDRVYNITIFKSILNKRYGLEHDVDFNAYNVGDKTYVKRNTEANMLKVNTAKD